MSDPRTTKTPPTARTEHPAAAADTARVNDEGTALTLEQRRQMLRNEFVQEALPAAPAMPGWHVCWLTTNSNYDPIHKRLRLGYELVRADEVKGFDHLKMRSGEYQGLVMCNEMVLAKIPQDLYQVIMEEFHHNLPLEAEESINSVIQNLHGNTDRTGRSLTYREEGFEEQELVKRRPVPTFI